MSSNRCRVKRVESAISICLLAVLLLIGVGVVLEQFDTDMSRFGIDTTVISKIENHKSQITNQLSPLVPAGFGTLSETEFYNSENLYEKINGKAPLYIESGFEKLLTRRFVSKDNESLWLELFVYDMGNIRNAFSVYSTQKRADATTMLSFAGPSHYYQTSNGLYFVHGKYYVELVGSTESAELDRAMVKIATKFGSEITVDDTKIAEFALLPKEHFVQDSYKLYLANAFGFEGLTNIFTARYKFGDETITAFISRRPNPREALTVTESYYDFLIDNGGVAKQSPIENCKVVDFYGTTEIVFAVGPFVAGIHEAENQQSAEKLAVMLINKLREDD